MLNTAIKQKSGTDGNTKCWRYQNFDGVEQPVLILEAKDYEDIRSSGLLPDDHFVISSDENQEITPELVQMWQKFMPDSQLVIAICKKSENIEIPISSAMKINI